MTIEAEFRVALQAKAILGEGLHWDDARSVLWMVDIHGRRVIAWQLDAVSAQEWTLPQRVGWVIPCARSDALLLGMQQGFALAREDDELALEWLACPFAGHAELRLNDAKADSSGAVWAGSLNNDDESRSDGCLFRLDPQGRVRIVDCGYQVANGPTLSPDARWMLHTDSGRRTIYAFDLDVASGRLDGKRVWKVFSEADGYPDGMCFDTEGCVWVAHWGAGCVSRFSADGSLLRRIALPAARITNVCFAGPDLDRLFVTSARVGMTPEEAAAQPDAGSLFEILAPGVRGLRSLPYVCSPA